MANNPTDNIPNLQSAKKEVRGFASDAKREAQGAANEIRNRAENIKNDFRDRFEGAGETAREYGEQIRDKADEVVRYIEREARANPLKVASIAFVTGLITALIIGRRD